MSLLLHFKRIECGSIQLEFGNEDKRKVPGTSISHISQNRTTKSNEAEVLAVLEALQILVFHFHVRLVVESNSMNAVPGLFLYYVTSLEVSFLFLERFNTCCHRFMWNLSMFGGQQMLWQTLRLSKGLMDLLLWLPFLCNLVCCMVYCFYKCMIGLIYNV